MIKWRWLWATAKNSIGHKFSFYIHWSVLFLLRIWLSNSTTISPFYKIYKKISQQQVCKFAFHYSSFEMLEFFRDENKIYEKDSFLYLNRHKSSFLSPHYKNKPKVLKTNCQLKVDCSPTSLAQLVLLSFAPAYYW